MHSGPPVDSNDNTTIVVIISTSVAALIALAVLLIIFGLCLYIYKNKSRNTHPTEDPYYSTIGAGLDPNVHSMRIASPPTQNEVSVNRTEQEPEYLSLIPSQENMTPANVVVPSTNSLTMSDINNT